MANIKLADLNALYAASVEEDTMQDISWYDEDYTSEKPTVVTTAVAAPSGGITAMCRHLIKNTTLTYNQIVAQVREAHPTAKTSVKSLASIARDMKKAGVELPKRGFHAQ
jgi:hypothetical protein